MDSLPFPPLTATHILNCSFHSWYPLFRSLTPKARLIPLTDPFLDYLRADGIILPPEDPTDDSGYSDSESEEDPSERWRDIHDKIHSTIAQLGGKVVPKLNWSAPKDATWMSRTNDMECQTPNDVYLLLKSSDFVTHDLEHALDGCVDTASIPYHLVLRKSFNLNPSLEFRCFVKDRTVIAISQREMNHFPFLFDLRDSFRSLIKQFFTTRLLPSFADPNFVFDVYIPPPHDHVWLIDINPWAARTDPLLFSWLELLQMVVPPSAEQQSHDGESAATISPGHMHQDERSDGEDVEEMFSPEFRLVARDDPEAYQFSTTKYSAHKLPKDVVDASMTPEGMKSMMEEWRKVMDGEGSEEGDGEGTSNNVKTP